MERHWLVKRGEANLAIFMLGWAATPNAVRHICPPGWDVLAVCRYTSVEPMRAAEFAAYRRICLFAWSFGVWVAEQSCAELPLSRAVALNGTPFPADARYGMRLRATLRLMQAAVRSGSLTPPATGRAMPTGPYPEPALAEKLAELEQLAEWSRARSGAGLAWDAAFIAEQDEIFPPANMWAYWQSVGLGTGMPGFHYPFGDPALVLQQLELACS